MRLSQSACCTLELLCFFLLFSSDVGIIFHENFFSHQWNYLLHIILFNAIKLFSPLVVATALDDNVGHFSTNSTNAVSTLSIVKINQPFIFGKKTSIIWFSIYVWVAAHIFSQEFVFLLFWPLFCTIRFRKILLRRLACFGQVWKSNPCPNVLASESASMEKIFFKKMPPMSP